MDIIKMAKGSYKKSRKSARKSSGGSHRRHRRCVKSTLRKRSCRLAKNRSGRKASVKTCALDAKDNKCVWVGHQKKRHSRRGRRSHKSSK